MQDRLLEELFSYEPGWDKAILDGQAKQIRQPVLERFSSPGFRERLMERIAAGEYRVRPPHEARVPKDDGTWRTVYANEAEDRILMTVVNDALFRLCPDMVHESCMSYQSGIGCGKVARQVSRDIQSLPEDPDGFLGYKIDLSKYFDSVPIRYIDGTFDMVEARLGESCVMEMLREYYHSDVLLDLDRKPVHRYTSLRQGCAVAAFLADAVLWPVDDMAAKSGAPYYRYSDDILVLGPDADKVFRELSAMLEGMGLALNPKKVERLRRDQWFTFLGFSLKGSRISMSKKRVGNFQAAIEKRTIRYPHDTDSGAAMSRVARYLYDASLTEYGYAEGLLPVVNCPADLRQMDLFILDCLRACDTGKDKIGGLGWDRYGKDGVVRRGRGRNVAANREKRPRIDGYVPLSHMRAALLSSRPAYDTYARGMCCPAGRT